MKPKPIRLFIIIAIIIFNRLKQQLLRKLAFFRYTDNNVFCAEEKDVPENSVPSGTAEDR